jgi:hypothetical protein
VKRIRAQLTYANVISTLCLFMLLGGSAYAVSQLPKDSVGTPQLKDGAVTLKKISKGSLATLGRRYAGKQGATGPAGAPGKDGQPGPAGPPGTAIRWALVNANGNITASSDGATKVTIPGQNASQYFIDFHTPVSGRPILASTSYAEDAGVADSLAASPCGGTGSSLGATTCPLLGGDNDHTVFVLSTSDGMLNNSQGFYVVVLP